MVQYPHPQLAQGGQSKRHLIKHQNKQRYAQNNKLFFYLLKQQIRSYYVEHTAHYHHPLPYSGLALPQLVQGGHSCCCNPGGVHQSPQTIRDTLKATEYFFVGLSLKYRANTINGRPFIPTQSPTLVLP